MRAIDDILGEAYTLDQVSGSRQKAIDLLVKEMQDEAIRKDAEARRQSYGAAISARARGACFVTSVLFDLLERSLSRA